MDKDLRYTYWNKASEKLTGIAAKEAIGKSLYELFSDMKGTKTEKAYLEVLKSKKVQSFENAYRIGNRDYIFEITAYPTTDGCSVFTKDITERKQAEEEVRKFKTIADSAGYGMAITDLKGNQVYLNQSFAQMHGYTVEELIS